MAFKPNENLAQVKATPEPARPKTQAQIPIEHSPLAEVEANSIELELDRINENLIAGTPEKITDERLEHFVNLYRAQAVKWETEEQIKKPRAKLGTKKVSHGEAMEL